MKAINGVLLFSVISLLIFSQINFAQHQVPFSVLSGGGASHTSPQYILSGTLGEAFTGKSVAVSNQMYSGFWYLYYEDVVTSVKDETIPVSFKLEQNFPNPFNPSTTIRFAVPEKKLVQIRLYTVIGEEVLLLVNEEKEQGWYEIKLNMNSFSSGVYIYRMNAGNYVNTRKMILIK
jgi:hypothetical protein